MPKRLFVIALSGTLCGAIAPFAQAQQKADSATRGTGVVSADDPNQTKSMERLKQAADRLRKSIQEMADQPAGPRRNDAIKAAHAALRDTQSAMIQLPPELRLSSADGGSGTGYTDSMARLKEAAQKLRESVQAMADQPAGPRRNEAMDQAREALLETQQAMINLPPELRK
ncbi:MAG: hypothetical protein ACT4PS_19435 [Betaproteobacteria bacterium]